MIQDLIDKLAEEFELRTSEAYFYNIAQNPEIESKLSVGDLMTLRGILRYILINVKGMDEL